MTRVSLMSSVTGFGHFDREVRSEIFVLLHSKTSRFIREQIGDRSETSVDSMYKNFNLGFFKEDSGLKHLCCCSSETQNEVES
jgi:hypothetical protein